MSIKSDGNGGVVFSKGAIALISLIISILMIAVPVAMYAATARADINSLEDKLVTHVATTQASINAQDEKITKYDDKLDQVRQNQAQILTKLDSIEDIARENREDIKELNKGG